MKNEIRYVKQRDDFSCGPVAILNAMKWLGCRCTYEGHLEYISEVCDCCEPDGTDPSDFDHALREIVKYEDAKVGALFVPGIKYVEDHLRTRGALVLNFLIICKKTRESWGHYVLVTDVSKTGKSFTIVNYSDKRSAACVLKRSTMVGLLKQRHCGGKIYPRAWFLEKK